MICLEAVTINIVPYLTFPWQ